MKPVTVTFSDLKFKTLGSVVFDGEKLIPSNDYAKNMVDFYVDQGMSPETWVKKFDGWSNGYIFSEITS